MGEHKSSRERFDLYGLKVWMHGETWAKGWLYRLAFRSRIEKTKRTPGFKLTVRSVGYGRKIVRKGTIV